MGTVTISFHTPEGEESIEVDSKTTKLYLRIKHIISIDLSPLKACANLQRLNLEHDMLRNIDLSPLSSCTALKELDLSYNMLQSIDLSALKACANLQKLDLDRNQLEAIDLSPLRACTNLQVLYLSRNQLEAIDLSPLKACKNLQELYLFENHLKEVDLSPLESCTALQELDLSGNQLQGIDLSPLKGCTNLQELVLSENPISKIRAGPLLSLQNLRSFETPRDCTLYELKAKWGVHEKMFGIPRWLSYERVLLLTQEELEYFEEKESRSPLKDESATIEIISSLQAKLKDLTEQVNDLSAAINRVEEDIKQKVQQHFVSLGPPRTAEDLAKVVSQSVLDAMRNDEEFQNLFRKAEDIDSIIRTVNSLITSLVSATIDHREKTEKSFYAEMKSETAGNLASDIFKSLIANLITVK